MYVIIGLLLTFFAILELGNKNTYHCKLFNFLVLCLTLFLCFRYGQGTDYYGYYLQYQYVDAGGSLLVNSLYHGEIGWYILLVLAKRIGFSFELFIGILSVIMMGSIYKAIRKYSPYGITSLLLLYPTFFLTYCFSAIRQGLVMSLFLGLGVDLLIQKKYIRYYVLTLILFLFHTSAIVLFLLPVVLHFKNRRIERWFLAAVLAGVIFGYTGFLNSIAVRVGVSVYFNVSISYTAILLRVILFYVIYKLHKENIVSNEEQDKVEDILYLLYSVGFIIYLMLAFSATLSQRLSMPLKAIEVLLLPLVIGNMDRRISQGGESFLTYVKMGSIRIVALVAAVILIINVETVKNINSYIDQGNYYSWVNVMNYPYITVFNKDNIRQYISHFDGEVN